MTTLDESHTASVGDTSGWRSSSPRTPDLNRIANAGPRFYQEFSGRLCNSRRLRREKPLRCKGFCGTPGGTRTHNLLIRSCRRGVHCCPSVLCESTIRARRVRLCSRTSACSRWLGCQTGCQKGCETGRPYVPLCAIRHQRERTLNRSLIRHVCSQVYLELDPLRPSSMFELRKWHHGEEGLPILVGIGEDNEEKHKAIPSSICKVVLRLR